MKITIICSGPAKDQSFVMKMRTLLCREGIEISCEACSGKAEVEHVIWRGRNGELFFVPERCFYQDPYRAVEFAALRDIRKIRLITAVDRVHYGTSYMATLYAAGILDAVFEDDAQEKSIAERVRQARNRRECREYYGICSMDDAVSALRVMKEDDAERYVRYISAGIDGEDMLARYRDVEKKLNFIENCCLAKQLPDSVLEEIRGEVKLERYGLPVSSCKRKGKLQQFWK